ncbi:hypothetical protein D3C76_983640 [compost metagenome]
MQHRIADHHRTDHRQGDLRGEALAQAIDRQQRQDHRLERGEQRHRPGNRRQATTESEQITQGHAAGLAARCTTAAQQQERSRHQQTDTHPKAIIVFGTEKPQQHRACQLTQRIAAAIQRHQPPAPLLDHQLIDPAFTDNEYEGQDHPDHQPQHQPDRITRQQRQQSDRNRPGPQAQAHQIGRAESRRQMAGDFRPQQDADGWHRGHHANGKRAVAPAFQAKRHQRHADTQGQADTQDRCQDGEISRPTHVPRSCGLIFLQDTQNKCGSGLAREEAITSNINVG